MFNLRHYLANERTVLADMMLKKLTVSLICIISFVFFAVTAWASEVGGFAREEILFQFNNMTDRNLRLNCESNLRGANSETVVVAGANRSIQPGSPVVFERKMDFSEDNNGELSVNIRINFDDNGEQFSTVKIFTGDRRFSDEAPEKSRIYLMALARLSAVFRETLSDTSLAGGGSDYITFYQKLQDKVEQNNSDRSRVLRDFTDYSANLNYRDVYQLKRALEADVMIFKEAEKSNSSDSMPDKGVYVNVAFNNPSSVTPLLSNKTYVSSGTALMHPDEWNMPIRYYVVVKCLTDGNKPMLQVDVFDMRDFIILSQPYDLDKQWGEYLSSSIRYMDEGFAEELFGCAVINDRAVFALDNAGKYMTALDLFSKCVSLRRAIDPHTGEMIPVSYTI